MDPLATLSSFSPSVLSPASPISAGESPFFPINNEGESSSRRRASNIAKRKFAESDDETRLRPRKHLKSRSVKPKQKSKPITDTKPWTKEQENLLHELFKIRPNKWSYIAKRMAEQSPGFKKIGKQCRERWINHVNPALHKEEWTIEEEDLLVEEYQKWGSQWQKISKSFPGRATNDLKNRYNSIQRRLTIAEMHSKRAPLKKSSSDSTSQESSSNSSSSDESSSDESSDAKVQKIGSVKKDIHFTPVRPTAAVSKPATVKENFGGNDQGHTSATVSKLPRPLPPLQFTPEAVPNSHNLISSNLSARVTYERDRIPVPPPTLRSARQSNFTKPPLLDELDARLNRQEPMAFSSKTRQSGSSKPGDFAEFAEFADFFN